MTARTLLVLALTAEVIGVGALWPFRETRTTEEALVDSGPLGIEATGRVVAIGDWNGDQQYVSGLDVLRLALRASADLITLSPDSKNVQIHLWDRSKARGKPTAW